MNTRMSLIMTLANTLCASTVAQQLDVRTIAILGQQAPGQPEGVILSSFNGAPRFNDHGDIAFMVNLRMAGQQHPQYEAIYINSEDTGNTPIVTVGDKAARLPGARYTRLHSFDFNNAQEVLFTSSYAPDPTGLDLYPGGVFFKPRDRDFVPIALELRPVHGLPAETFYYSMIRPQLNDEGDFTFYASIYTPQSPDTYALMNSARPADLSPLAQNDTPVPWTNSGMLYSNIRSTSTYINDEGRIFFQSSIYRGDASQDSNRVMLKTDANGQIVIAAREGDQLPGRLGDIKLDDFVFNYAHYAMGSTDDYIIRTDLIGDDVEPSNSTAVIANTGGTGLRTVLRQGDKVPSQLGSITAGNLRSAHPVLNSSGNTAFISRFINQDNALLDKAIYSDHNGSGIEAVVLITDQPPGFDDDTRYTHFLSATINDQGRVAYFANLSGGQKGIFYKDPGQPATRAIWTGATIDIGTDEPNPLPIINIGLAMYFNSPGSLAFLATLDDNSELGASGIFILDSAVTCTADVNNDGELTPTDFTAWINAFNNNDPECDQNSDGSCTPTDFTAWIANYNTGCD